MRGKENHCKKQHHFSYNRLLGRIKEYYHTQERFADELGIGSVSLSQRLGNKLEFTQDEILKACQLLNIAGEEIEDFFFSEVYVKASSNNNIAPF